MYESSVRYTNTASSSPPSTDRPAVIAEGLGKKFGDLWALHDLDLSVPKGSVLGLLGHNGAGKTTAIRILTTLSEPTTGRATVAGIDVTEDPRAVQNRIGVAGQSATVDGLLTGRANLELVGRLYHLSRADTRNRAEELLEGLGLTDAADRLAKTYSGGMRRRLDLAASMVVTPEVLFLDEPTTGLDPRSRNDLWDVLRSLVREGTTLILTTQYLEEADRLADDIVVLDHGRAIAHGTPAQLKARVGQSQVDIIVEAESELDAAAHAVASLVDAPPAIDREGLKITAPLRDGVRTLQVMRALDAADIDAIEVQRRETTLDDVFLTLTTETSPDHALTEVHP